MPVWENLADDDNILDVDKYGSPDSPGSGRDNTARSVVKFDEALTARKSGSAHSMRRRSRRYSSVAAVNRYSNSPEPPKALKSWEFGHSPSTLNPFGLPPLDPGRRKSLPPRLQLPHPTLKGMLYRQKGSWKKKWTKEIFVVQGNVLLTGSKEQPFLVKLCIPLKNIQRLEEVEPHGKAKTEKWKFLIQYLNAGKKAQSKVTTIICRGESESERKMWLHELRAAQAAVANSINTIVDYVPRLNAESAIADLHDAIRRAGRTAIVNRLQNLVHHQNANMVNDAFHRLVEHCQNALLQDKQRTVQKTMDDANIMVAQTKKSANEEIRVLGRDKEAQLAARIMENMRHRKIASHFRDFIWRVQQQRNLKIVEDSTKMLRGTLLDQSVEYARQIVWWRKILMEKALQGAYIRRLGIMFSEFKSYSKIFATRRFIVQRKLRTLLALRQTRENEISYKTFLIWRDYAARWSHQISSLRHLLVRYETTRRQTAVTQWKLECIRYKTCAAVGLEKLHLWNKSQELSQKHRGLLRLQSWKSMQEEALTGRVVDNISMANDEVLAAFNRVPKERACFIASLAVRGIRLDRLRCGFEAFRTNQMDKIGIDRGCIVVVSILTRLHHKRLSSGLVGFASFSYRFNTYLVTRARGAMRLSFILQKAIGRNLVAGFITLRYSAETHCLQKQRDLMETAKRNELDKLASLIVSRLERKRLFKLSFGLQALHRNSSSGNMMGSLVRVQSLQRVIFLASRMETAAKSRAFHALKEEFVPSPLPLSVRLLASPSNVPTSAAATAGRQALRTSRTSLVESQRRHGARRTSTTPPESEASETTGALRMAMIQLSKEKKEDGYTSLPSKRVTLKLSRSHVDARKTRLKKQYGSKKLTMRGTKADHVLSRAKRSEAVKSDDSSELWRALQTRSVTLVPQPPPTPPSPFAGLSGTEYRRTGDMRMRRRSSNTSMSLAPPRLGSHSPMELNLGPLPNSSVSDGLSLFDDPRGFDVNIEDYLQYMSERRTAAADFAAAAGCSGGTLGYGRRDIASRPVQQFLDDDTRRMLEATSELSGMSSLGRYVEDGTGEAPAFDLGTPDYESLVLQAEHLMKPLFSKDRSLMLSSNSSASSTLFNPRAARATRQKQQDSRTTALGGTPSGRVYRAHIRRRATPASSLEGETGHSISIKEDADSLLDAPRPLRARIITDSSCRRPPPRAMPLPPLSTAYPKRKGQR